MSKVARITNDNKLLLAGELIEETHEPTNNIELDGVLRGYSGGYTTNPETPNIYYVKGLKGGFIFPQTIFEIGETYALSFKIMKTSGNILTIGGHSQSFEDVEVYLDDELIGNDWGSGLQGTYPNDNLEHNYKVILTFNDSAIDGNLYVQINRDNGYATEYTAEIYDLKLEKINKMPPNLSLDNTGDMVILGELIESAEEDKMHFLSFDGSGSVTVPHNNIFNITDAITISARIKITDTSETDYGQFMTKGNAFAWFLGVRRSDGYTVWYSKMNGGLNNNWAIRDYRELVDGHWHNIVFSYDKNAGENNQRLYIDGVLKNQKTTTGVFDTTTNPINLVTSSFKGGFRDARIYNRQLTDNEVVDLFEEKSVTDGLVGHWEMNEGAGNIAYDSSGNGNNGTITGGAIWEEDVEQVNKLVQFQPNGDLVLYGELIEDYNF